MKRDKDVYLPFFVCTFGLCLIAAGVYLIIAPESEASRTLGYKYAIAISFILGLLAVVWWKNQWIKVINDREFIYSSLFGIRRIYRFDDIIKLKSVSSGKGYPYMTIILNNGRVHIEGFAMVSDRFAEAVNKKAGPLVKFHKVRGKWIF